jgi:hypothetical protein
MRINRERATQEVLLKEIKFMQDAPNRRELKTKPARPLGLWLIGVILGFVFGIGATLLWVAHSVELGSPEAILSPATSPTLDLQAAPTFTPDPLTATDSNTVSMPTAVQATDGSNLVVTTPTETAFAIRPATPTSTPTVTKPQKNIPLPTATKAKAPVVRGKLGEVLKYQDYALIVTQLEKSDKVDDAGGISDQAAPDEQFIFVNLTYTNGAAETDLDTNLFFHSPTIRDSNNFIYTLDSFKGKTPALNDMAGNNLRAGDKTKGWLTYQIPKTAKGLVFEFQLRNTDPFTPAFGVFQVALDTDASFTLPSDQTPNGVGSSGEVGQTTNAGAYFMTVTKAETTSVIDGYRAKTGTQFVTVKVTFQSNADQDVDINPNDLSLKDSEGFRYSNTFRRQPELQNVDDLPAGTKVQGWATFEVPTTASGFVLQFLPSSAKSVALSVALN